MTTRLRQRVTGWLNAIRLVPPPMGGDPASAPAPVPARDDLWAVWRYDQFPYYLCAQVEKFTPDGRVYVKGYTGMVFRPVTILPGKKGEDFRRYLTAARTVYREMQECFENAVRDQLIKDCEAVDVPRPPVWRAGFRGYGMADTYTKAVNHILAGNGPAFAYGHDVKGEAP